MKPPDVIVLETKRENPLLKWANLREWAILNNDKYLELRARDMIFELLT